MLEMLEMSKSDYLVRKTEIEAQISEAQAAVMTSAIIEIWKTSQRVGESLAGYRKCRKEEFDEAQQVVKSTEAPPQKCQSETYRR